MGKAVPKTAKGKQGHITGHSRMVSEPEIATNLSLGTVREEKYQLAIHQYSQSKFATTH
jgi:hypothetical protein